MLGSLVVTFYERGSAQSTEIWAYPDATLNVVVSAENEERALACSPLQLERVMEGKSVVLRQEDTSVTMKRHEGQVCVDVDCAGNKRQQCIDAKEFEQALVSIEDQFGYVA